MSDTTETAELTFEAGYERLQTIAGRVNEDEVPVSEMCDLYGEGKGLEQALTAFLDEQRALVEAIERGEGIQAFRITQTAAAPSDDDGDEEWDDDDVTPTSRFEPAPPPAPKPAGASDDDIPF